MDGIINILKPPGMTSHDVVNFIRKQLGIKRIGHTGTLDPGAVGVLVICIGKATKVTELITNQDKQYRAEIKFGIKTNTYDGYGNIIEKNEVKLDKQKLMHVIKNFIGDIEQIPPMYSAIKIKGKKLYEFARQGIEVKRKPRKINIKSIDIISIEETDNTAIIDINCSKGTYIRTLCSDIGDVYGCGAYMSFLLRTKNGDFNINDSITLEEFKALNVNKKLLTCLIPIDKLFLDHPIISIDELNEKKVLNGNPIIMSDIKEGQLYRVYNKEGKFLCISQAVMSNDNKSILKVKKSFY